MRTIASIVAISASSLVLVLAASAVAQSRVARAPSVGHEHRVCGGAHSLAKVFPKADLASASAGLVARRRVERIGARAPHWPGWCGNWTTTYRGLSGRGEAFRVSVTVSLYDTRSHALKALAEPAFGPVIDLPRGVRMRTLLDSLPGAAVSVVRNVFVLTIGEVDSPDFPVETMARAQLWLHRRIRGVVLG